MKEKVLKIIPDFFKYYLETDIEEYESEDQFIIYTLEHEIDIYDNYKEYGFKSRQGISYINKDNVRKVKNLLKWYYAN